MDWRELARLIPVIAGSVDPRAGEIASAIHTLADHEIRIAMDADPAKTREQVITEAAAQWEAGLDKAKLLRQMGHEGEEP